VGCRRFPVSAFSRRRTADRRTAARRNPRWVAGLSGSWQISSRTCPTPLSPSHALFDGPLHLATLGTMLNVYTGALAKLGSRIVNGGLASNTSLTLEGLQTEFGVSRTIAREVVQVLASMGLVESRRRTGVRVRPRSDWDHYDPAIIRWRLDGDGRAAHLYDLSQLRAAVEPPSSALAAVNADATVRAEIVRLAHAMETAGAAADLSTFLDLDIRFHRMLLAASGNVMFDALGDVVEEVLRGRTDHNLMPSSPKPTARRLHLLVAEGVAQGDAQTSQTAMQAICGEVVAAMQQPRPIDPEGRQSKRSNTVA
jgi:DNA-binding FadR family transcriptional regulator